MRLKIVVVLLVPIICAGSSLLTQTARQVLAQPGGRAQAEGFLKQALIENPNDPEPLTLLAMLRQTDLKNRQDDLRADVEPMFEQLLILREQDPATKPAELALALELNARILNEVNRSPDALPFSKRALAIRKQIVHEMYFPPAEKAPNPIYRVGQGVSAPSVLKKADPSYSEDARFANISGTVLVLLTVDVDGLAKQIEIVRSLGFGLDESAAQAMAKWRFRPGMKDGQPVPVKATIEVNFRLL